MRERERFAWEEFTAATSGDSSIGIPVVTVWSKENEENNIAISNQEPKSLGTKPKRRRTLDEDEENQIALQQMQQAFGNEEKNGAIHNKNNQKSKKERSRMS